jgi:hypothetical protein
MYNVGFGDCFLIEFPRPAQAPYRVLVDCGAHTSGYPRQGWKPEDTVDQIITDISDGGAAPFLDLVVASHRHQDHVSGFRANAWAGVAVGQVWMPWTEHPTDPQATEIRNRQSRLALGLTHSFDNDPGFWLRWSDPQGRAALRSLATNSLTNEDAMATLHHGFRGRPKRRFIPDGPERTITPAACPGLTIHILGPSRDPEVIRDMDPPAGQSYLRYANPQVLLTSERRSSSLGPFAASFTFDEARYSASEFGPTVDQKIKDAAASFMRGDDFTVAVSLDKAVNGTSVMLMLEFGDAFLLFPGDAQWGAWNAALTDPDTRDLLSRTTFYKVGHHGSHNATPIDFVEGVLNQTVQIWGSAISVRPIDFWPEIPRDPLVEELKLRSERVIRSDRPGRRRQGVSIRKDKVGIDFLVPC